MAPHELDYVYGTQFTELEWAWVKSAAQELPREHHVVDDRLPGQAKFLPQVNLELGRDLVGRGNVGTCRWPGDRTVLSKEAQQFAQRAQLVAPRTMAPALTLPISVVSRNLPFVNTGERDSLA
jgi:hypothetical protein